MDLSNLKPAKGATKSRKRIGRGVGSGYGGHSSTKGNKGQKSRAGASIPVWFEGGQMPLQRRLPKFGFKNPFRVAYKAVNVARLQKLVDDGALDGSAPVTPELLRELGQIGKGDLVKVLGSGELTAKLQVTANAFSASARKKIEEAGGSVTEL
ncbi:MAG: 50S ribosomal protein L15 [Rhodothermales bacterium]